MKTKFRDSFYRDVAKVRDRKILSILQSIIEDVTRAPTVESIPHAKRLTGKKGAYRIRVKDYRVGIFIEANVIEFVRFLHRKEVYRYFP